MDIFVGSLPFKLKESELKELFEQYGEVTSAKIIIDKITRQNKGFGFVEMPDDSQAFKAIKELNGSEVQGRAIVVNKSEPRKDPERGGSSGGTSTRGDSRRDDFSKGNFKGGGSKGGFPRRDEGRNKW